MHYINKTRFFALFFTLTLLFTLILSYSISTGKNISNAVVRLHIIANSDTAADQALKLKVRDRIIKDTADLFNSTTDSNEALAIARNNSEYIRKTAVDEIKRQGFDLPVKVTVGKSMFPTKFYEDTALPAGKYNAVRIEIGKAEGQNWWCVMYPPLCFTEGTISLSEKAKATLKDNLSDSEYKLVTQSDDSLPVEIRFKLVEIFQKLF